MELIHARIETKRRLGRARRRLRASWVASTTVPLAWRTVFSPRCRSRVLTTMRAASTHAIRDHSHSKSVANVRAASMPTRQVSTRGLTRCRAPLTAQSRPSQVVYRQGHRGANVLAQVDRATAVCARVCDWRTLRLAASTPSPAMPCVGVTWWQFYPSGSRAQGGKETDYRRSRASTTCRSSYQRAGATDTAARAPHTTSLH